MRVREGAVVVGGEGVKICTQLMPLEMEGSAAIFFKGRMNNTLLLKKKFVF